MVLCRWFIGNRQPGCTNDGEIARKTQWLNSFSYKLILYIDSEPVKSGCTYGYGSYRHHHHHRRCRRCRRRHPPFAFHFQNTIIILCVENLRRSMYSICIFCNVFTTKMSNNVTVQHQNTRIRSFVVLTGKTHLSSNFINLKRTTEYKTMWYTNCSLFELMLSTNEFGSMRNFSPNISDTMGWMISLKTL